MIEYIYIYMKHVTKYLGQLDLNINVMDGIERKTIGDRLKDTQHDLDKEVNYTRNKIASTF